MPFVFQAPRPLARESDIRFFNHATILTYVTNTCVIIATGFAAKEENISSRDPDSATPSEESLQ